MDFRLSHHLSAAVLAASLLVHPASGAQTRGVQFTDTTPVAVALPPGGKATITLGVQNPLRTGVGVGDARFYFVGAVAPAVRATLGATRMDPGAVATLQLVLTDPGRQGIEGTGYVTVATDSGVITRVVQIARPAAKAPLASWTTTTTLGCVKVMPGCHQPSLPLDGDSGEPGELLRKADDSYNGIASVRVAARDGAGGARALRVDGLDGPGTYRGPLRVGAASVDLTLHARHWVGWLVVTLIAGVLTGMWLSHYTSARRAIWEFRARWGELDERLHALAVADGLTPETSGVRLRLADALRSVNALGSAAFKEVEQQPGYVEAVGQLRAAEASLAAWSGLSAKLSRVRQALLDAEGALAGARQPPTYDGVRLDAPAMLPWARSLIAARRLPLDKAAELSARLDEAPGALEQVVALNRTAGEALDEIAVLRGRMPEPLGTETLRPIEEKLGEAWWEVWRSESPAALQARQTEAEMGDVQRQLARLGHHLVTGLEGRDELQGAGFDAVDRQAEKSRRAAREAEAKAREAEAKALEPEADAELDRFRKPRRWRERIKAWDWTFLALATGLAVLSGLKQFYFDKQFFGTPADYVGAILWGFGVKTALDLVVATAGKFFGARSGAAAAPAPRAAAPAGP
ncbi:MAG TPA: hypothetical protein VGC13_24480 [Longimicrobium sp.]|uniref:hypothetical protein n=1 Tax=Longimicrobium sp. TaxID=2029185 RepID=UPI002EDB849D